MCDMTHSYVWHESFMYVTRLIHMCAMTHSYVWQDSFICVTWLIHVWHDSFICVTWLIHTFVTWLIHMCDMTHVWHDSFMFDITYSYVLNHLFISMTWLFHVHDMKLQFPAVSKERVCLHIFCSFQRDGVPADFLKFPKRGCACIFSILLESIFDDAWRDRICCMRAYLCVWVYVYVCMRVCVYVCMCVCVYVCVFDATLSYTWYDVSIFCKFHRKGEPMGSLRSVVSIKLWVSFAEYRLFYRALLQNRPIIIHRSY